jgi:hypothetical protein
MEEYRPGMYDSMEVYQWTRYGPVQSNELFNRAYQEPQDTNVQVPQVSSTIDELVDLLRRVFFVVSTYLAGHDGIVVWMKEIDDSITQQSSTQHSSCELLRQENTQDMPTTVDEADTIMRECIPRMFSGISRIVRADYHNAGKNIPYIIYYE